MAAMHDPLKDGLKTSSRNEFGFDPRVFAEMDRFDALIAQGMRPPMSRSAALHRMYVLDASRGRHTKRTKRRTRFRRLCSRPFSWLWSLYCNWAVRGAGH